MSARNLILSGIEIPLHSSLSLEQRYEPLQSTWRGRTMGGSLIARTSWGGKLRTVITARGVIPPGIQSIDYEVAHLLSCVEAITLTSVGASNVFTLPVNRRSDVGSEPFGRALVANRWVSTPVAIVTNTATLTTVTNATQYQVAYFPEITVSADPPVQSGDSRTNDWTWTLTAEEV